MALPVPSHLAEIAVPLDEPVGANELQVRVQCTCGERRFQLRYAGEVIEEGGVHVLGEACVDDRYFFQAEAHCAGCRREHVLLDKDFHGWNGLMCHDPEQAAVPRPPLAAWTCPGCSGLDHHLAVFISGEGDASFLEESGDVDLTRWPDAFGWFTLDATCAQCDREAPGLIQCETM